MSQRLDWCMVTSMMLSKIVFQSVRYFVEQTAVLFESGSGNKIDGYSSTLHCPWIFSCFHLTIKKIGKIFLFFQPCDTENWTQKKTWSQIVWPNKSSSWTRWRPECGAKAILLFSQAFLQRLGQLEELNSVWKYPLKRKHSVIRNVNVISKNNFVLQLKTLHNFQKHYDCEVKRVLCLSDVMLPWVALLYLELWHLCKEAL